MKLDFGFNKEWKELKKFNNLKDEQRSIVFYAENKASMNHFKLLISELTKERNLEICYVTSVKNDPIFSLKDENIYAFYIGDGIVRTKFFLTLKAKVLIMDMPDLESFHIKRSKIYPVHYIYVFHSMFSTHSYLRKEALDNYDTIFCVGEFHEKEIRWREREYNLKPKNLIPYGFGRLDSLLQEKQNYPQINFEEKTVIIAPSYGENNLLEVCGLELLNILLESDFVILLRPHYKILKDSKKLIEIIRKRYEKNPNFILEEGIIPSRKFHSSKCMISDWSGISFEYAFTHEQKVIFIDVPKKILNKDFEETPSKPIEVLLRHKIGHVVSTTDIKKIPDIISNMNKNDLASEEIRKIRSQTIFNIGEASKKGADFIEKICFDKN